MAELEIIRSEHQDDQRQRRMNFHALCQTFETVPARLEWIVPHRAAPIQAVFHHAYSPGGGVHFAFKNARPTLIEGQSVTRAGDDAPGQRVGVNENLLHLGSY